MMKAMVVAVMMMMQTIDNAQVATVVETYDDTMIVETAHGEEVYLFDNMTEQEMYAETVLLINDTVVVLA